MKTNGWTKLNYNGKEIINESALEDLKEKNEQLTTLIKEFVCASDDVRLKLGGQAMWCSSTQVFEMYVKSLTEERTRKQEEDRVRIHVENILKEKGVIKETV